MLFPNCYDFSIANILSAYYLTYIVPSKINHNVDAIISFIVYRRKLRFGKVN